ncbi:MAG: tetratricopeptide repeat protein [Pseudomonadota bacterium]
MQAKTRAAPSAPAFVVRVLAGRSEEPALFLGSGTAIDETHVLTCKHVITQHDPLGRPTSTFRHGLAVACVDGAQVAVRRSLVDENLDLAILELERPVGIGAPTIVSGLARALEPRLKALPLVVVGYAEVGGEAEPWQHEVNHLVLLSSYRTGADTLMQLQLSGGLPVGTSGGPVLVWIGNQWLYLGTVFLGGERAATSRVLMADSVIAFLRGIGLGDLRRIDAAKVLNADRREASRRRARRLPAPLRWATIPMAIIALLGGAYGVWHFWSDNALARVEPASLDKMLLPLPNVPSIAVLPFISLTGDHEGEAFAGAITEALITDLSKVSGLFVIARDAVLAYAGNDTPPNRVAEELGAQYLLEGSIQRGAGKLTVHAQLIDMIGGRQQWGEQYDGLAHDVLTIQDDIALSVVEAVEASMTPTERAALAEGETTSISAFDWFVRGADQLRESWRTSLGEPAEAFKHAVTLDPGYGRAYAALASTYWEGAESGRYKELGVDNLLQARAEAGRWLDLALQNPTSLAHQLSSTMHLMNRRHDEAIADAGYALELSPNDPDSHIALARALIFAGRPAEALPHIERAMRLNPRFTVVVSDTAIQATTSAPTSYLVTLGLALFGMERWESAVSLFERVLVQDPDTWEAAAPLAAAYAHLDQPEEAATALARLVDGQRSMLGRDPSIIDALQAWPYRQPADATRLFDGLRSAGLS